MIRRLRLHGRRSAVIASTASVAVVGLALVASAQLGSTPTDTADPAATSSPAAAGNGDDNVAVAVGKDGKSVWAIRLKVVQTDAAVVDAGNAAVAAGGCTDCQTVAIAIEGVLVTGDTEVVQPVNIALALNDGCTNCQTLAAAYQTVIGYGEGKVRITGEGRQKIADLRKQLHDLRSAGLPLEQVAAEVDRIAGEFADVLRTQVVVIERGKDSAEGGAATGSSPAASGSASSDPSATASAEPSASSSTSADPAPSTSTSGSATPSPSASASAGG